MKEFLPINDTLDIDNIIDRSSEKPQIIFKHSTACPISRISYNKLKEEYPYSDEEAEVYEVMVIEQRPISNYIAEKLKVNHESPQVILVKEGVAFYNESHLMIRPIELRKQI